jgi:hypothetical protein
MMRKLVLNVEELEKETEENINVTREKHINPNGRRI